MIPRILYPLAPFFRLVINVIGWRCLTTWKVLSIINTHKRAVLVFPHTSLWDFSLLLLYAFAYPRIFSHIWTAMKPQLFRNKILAFIFKSLHFIPATRSQEKGNGKNYTNRVSEHILSHDKCYFLIAPEGMLKKNQWRSGYYWIAVKAQCPFIVCGFDFETKVLHISEPITLPEGCTEKTGSYFFQSVQNDLKKRTRDIVPLYPEQSLVEIRNHNSLALNYVIDCSMIGSLVNFCLYVYFSCTKLYTDYFSHVNVINYLSFIILITFITNFYYCFNYYTSQTKLQGPSYCHLYIDFYMIVLQSIGDCHIKINGLLIKVSLCAFLLYTYFAYRIISSRDHIHIHTIIRIYHRLFSLFYMTLFAY